MSPRRGEPSWQDLRVGITVAAAAILAVVVVIALGSGRGPFRPDTYTMYVLLDTSRQPDLLRHAHQQQPQLFRTSGDRGSTL